MTPLRLPITVDLIGSIQYMYWSGSAASVRLDPPGAYMNLIEIVSPITLQKRVAVDPQYL